MSAFFALIVLITGIISPVSAKFDTVIPIDLYQDTYEIGNDIVSLRSENSKTYYLGDSKYRCEIGGIQHYKDNYADASEQWKDIDLTPDKDGNITRAPYTAVRKDGAVIFTDKKTGDSVIIKPLKIGISVATLNDMSVVAFNEGVKLQREIRSAEDALTAEYDIIVKGKSVNINADAVDANGLKVPIEYSIKDGKLIETISRLEAVTSAGSKQAVKYPIKVDPTLTVQPTSQDTWFRNGGSGLDNNDFIAVDPNSGNPVRSLLQFDISGLSVGATINTATMSCYYYGYYGTDPVGRTYTASRVLRRDWVESEATWSIYKTGNNWTTAGCSSNGNDYTTTDAASDTVPAAYGWMDWNVTNIVDTCYTNSYSTVDIRLHDGTNETDSQRQSRFYGKRYATDTTKCPKLVIDYTAGVTVTTQAATNVEETTATGNGNITALTGGNATERGFEYDTDSGAPYANSAYDSGSYGTGAYTKAITGLTKGELYYMRAYATNPVGTGYGSEVTFLTKPDEPNNFTATPGDGKVDLSWTNGTGSDKVMIRYRTDGSYPTGVTDGTQAYFNTGTSYEHSGLSNGTTYKYRGWSYVTESGLEQYSDTYIEASATPGGIATVTTNDASLVEETTATTGGNITDLNGAGNCTRRGVEYDTDSGAPYANSSYEDGDFGTGSYNRNLTSLTKGELYYFRAYAVNTNGTGYGSEKTFLTKPDEPNSLSATADGENDIDLTWNKGTGAQKTIIRGKKDSYPANIADGSEVYNDTGTSTTHSGLSAGEHWYYRAWSYVTEGALEQWSDTYDEDNATTQAPPQVITGAISGRNKTWLVANAEITNLGASDITVRGFDYGLTDAYGSSVTTTDLAGYPLGNYSAIITGLTTSTLYHYRAKVYNGAWGYGADKITATTGSPVIEYYFQDAADNTTSIYGVNWAAQTFTTDTTTARTVTSIRLLLNRVGNPGTVTVSLRNTSDGKPTGIDIAAGTIDGNSLIESATWYQIDLADEKSLSISTQYAICVNASDGDISNYVEWSMVDAGGFDDGTGVTSTDSGLTWTMQTYDFNFEIWGNSSMVVEDVKILTGYKETGDWLIAVRYINTTAPYYDTYDAKQYFALQLVHNDVVIAQSAIPAWGNSVGNIYLSAAQVSGLTYGDDFIVRMYGNFAGNPYTDFVLSESDWIGSDLSRLDSWVITSAAVIGDYYDDLLTTYIAGRGEVLNATGGAIFNSGITGLSTIRPELFQIYTSTVDYVPEITGQAQRISMANWQEAWGEDGVVMITRISNWLGVDGGYIGGMFFVIMMLALAILAFPAGHTTAANILSIPCLGLAVFFGLDLVWLIMLALFAAFLLFKNQFMDK